MFLAKLKIANFRRIADIEINFQAGLNIIVGPNNVGKTAVVDALRIVLAGHDEPPERLTIDDIHRPAGGDARGGIRLEYTFRGLSGDDEADFITAIVPDGSGNLEARVVIVFDEPDQSGRLRPKRWCGQNQDVDWRGVPMPIGVLNL